MNMSKTPRLDVCVLVTTHIVNKDEFFKEIRPPCGTNHVDIRYTVVPHFTAQDNEATYWLIQSAVKLVPPYVLRYNCLH